MYPASTETSAHESQPAGPPAHPQPAAVLVCPVCGGYLLEVRAKLQCTRCHMVCETCCDGGQM